MTEPRPPYCAADGCTDRALSGEWYCDHHILTTPAPGDPVNPQHYKSHPSEIECIQITEHMSFCLGNAVKYIWRVDSDLRSGMAVETDKPRTDLRKAIWYIEREIKRLG